MPVSLFLPLSLFRRSRLTESCLTTPLTDQVAQLLQLHPISESYGPARRVHRKQKDHSTDGEAAVESGDAGSSEEEDGDELSDNDDEEEEEDSE